MDIDGSPAPSDSASNSASPYAYTSLNDGSTVAGSMYSGQEHNLSPEVNPQIMSEGQGITDCHVTVEPSLIGGVLIGGVLV